MKLCFATNNKHKLQEVAQAVKDRFQILSLSELSVNEDLPETKDTFEGNALQKARFVFENYNIPCFADDSGLVVKSLNGEPGVFSARYAGPQRSDSDNINLLLSKLNNASTREASFITVIALVGLGPDIVFEGSVSGEITRERKGSQGFGYDPVFQPEGFTRTFAEMSLEEKNQHSHRAKATQKLVSYLNIHHPR